MPTPRLDAINPNEVLLYLGYKSGAVPTEVEDAVSACCKTILENARPRAVWRVLALEGTAVPAAGLTLEGKDMKALLSGCREAVFLAATLGSEVEQLLRRVETVDMAQALTLDAAASAAIEAVCDNLEADLRQEYGARGLHLTDRFSPGYGDLPLAQQKDFCALLDTQRRIGVTLSGSCIMVPRKSVTAVMGVSPTPKPRRARGCQHCNLFRSCPYRHDGRSCGNA